jgi:hypothetical protein
MMLILLKFPIDSLEISQNQTVPLHYPLHLQVFQQIVLSCSTNNKHKRSIKILKNLEYLKDNPS